LGAPPRIRHIPTWLIKSSLVLLRWVTPLRVHGVIEFPLTVLTHDVISPAIGQHRLADHYREVRPTR
jgi:hypothetical protein